MRRSTWMVAMGAVLAVAAGQAAVAQAMHDNSQQDKMKTCNADAKTKALTGADRKTFMKTCLSNHGAAAAAPAVAPAATAKGNSQQEKMKSCNADAKTKALKGTDRKAFMRGCLKADSTTTH